MNKLLHIEHDFNIVDVVDNSQARLEDVEAFLTGQRGAPHLDPLPVYWNKLSSPWNTQLAASFATHYIQMKPTADRTQILDYFAQRLETLRKCLIRSSAKEGETEDALINRHASKRLRDLKQNRTQSRKKRVSLSILRFESKLTVIYRSMKAAVEYVKQASRPIGTAPGTCYIKWLGLWESTDSALMTAMATTTLSESRTGEAPM